MTCTRLTRFALALSMLAAGTASAETYGLLDISSSTGFFDTINVAGIDVTEDGVLFSHQVADDDFTVYVVEVCQVSRVDMEVAFVFGDLFYEFSELLSVGQCF